jgi:four helix bundle protein
MKKFRELRVWQTAKSLSISIYKATSDWPDSEKFGLISQVRRAAVSVAANIAEGSARGSGLDHARFVKIALGSVAEVITYLEIASELDYGSASERAELMRLYEELAPQLVNLANRLSAKHVREEVSGYSSDGELSE